MTTSQPSGKAGLKSLNPNISLLEDTPNTPMNQNDDDSESSSHSDSFEAKGLVGSMKRVRSGLFGRKKRARRSTLTLDVSMRKDLTRLRRNRAVKDQIMRQRTVRALTLVTRPKRKMKIEEEEDISAFMRCRQRIRTPSNLRCVCQVILVIFMIFIVNLHAMEKTYKRHMRASFQELFAVHPYQEPDNSEFEKPFLVTTTQVENALKQVANTFWSLQNDSVDYYALTNDTGSTIQITIEDLNGVQEVYFANDSWPGPLFEWNNATLDEHVEDAFSITLRFHIQTFLLRDSNRYCHSWSFDYKIRALFGETDLGQTLSIYNSKCSEEQRKAFWDVGFTRTALFSFLLIVFAILNLILGGGRIYRAYEVWRSVNVGETMISSSSEQRKLYGKGDIDWLFWRFMSFSKWNIILNHLGILLYGWMSYLDAIYYIDAGLKLDYLECIITFWSCMVLLFSVDAIGGEYAGFLDTMRRAYGPVLRFAITMFMVFLGFTLMGVASFAIPGGLLDNTDDAMVTLYAVMVGDSVLDTFHQCSSGGSGLNYWYGTFYMLIFGIMFIIVLINVVRVQIEFSFFEAVPALVPEEQHDDDHEPNEYIEGWKDLGVEDKKPEPRLFGFDFLGGSPSMRDISRNPKNPPIVFWSRSDSAEKDVSQSTAVMPKPLSNSKIKSYSQPLPFIEEAGVAKPTKKKRVVVKNEDIVRFFMDRIKEIRRSSSQSTRLILDGVDQERLREKGLHTVEKIVAEYRARLRDALTISARILNVELSSIGLEDELSPLNSENDFAHFEPLLSPRWSPKGTQLSPKGKPLESIHEKAGPAPRDKDVISLQIMNPTTTEITDDL